MKNRLVTGFIVWLRMQWSKPDYSLGRDIENYTSTTQVQASRILVILMSLPIFLFLGLTLLRDQLVPVHSLSNLIAPMIAWAMLFLSSFALFAVHACRQNSGGLMANSYRWLVYDEANIAVCFILSHICAFNGEGSSGSLWSDTLLPMAFIVSKLLFPTASDQQATPRAMRNTAIATIVSFHYGVTFLAPTIHTLLIDLFKTLSLSTGLLLCEKLGKEPLVIYEGLGDLPRSTLTPPTSFILRLRNISFLVTITLAVSLIVLYPLEPFDAFLLETWKRELSVSLVELGRWPLLFWLLWEQHWSAFVIGLFLAGLSSIELMYQSRNYLLRASELFIAISLHSSNLIDRPPIPARHIRILLITVCLICGVIAIAFIRPRSTSSHIRKHHPIEDLIHESRIQFSNVLAKQSRTLEEAVREYQARTGMPPPPKFDVWFAFAQANNVVMIDEYDTINDLIKPFWGLPPSTIRQNARDAIGAEGGPYTGFRLRNGRVFRTIYGGWFADPLAALLESFVKHLPDMDLVLNYKDEPSVVVPHDLLAKLVEKPVTMKPNLQSSFSERPSDLVDNIPTHYGSKTLGIGRHTIWSQLIQSCPLDSAARNITGGSDSTFAYAYNPLGFIYNITAFTNACNQPSLPFHHGFFDRPDTMNICSNLVPVFSVSKVSTFNDIIFPSPWHYSERVVVNESLDMDWELKQNQLHWRGTTTTGYAINGGWRRHHRQRLVAAFDNIKHPVTVLKKVDEGWVEDTMSPEIAQSLFDVKFTTISGSSTEEAREAQAAEFDIAPREEQQDLWKWKYLLDADGHGLSGRYYALLKSKSLVFKCTMFREWHDEWLWPWVHYVPLSLEGRDWFEAVRYFALEETGQREAERMANESHEWSRRVLRKEDMEAWMFRLLLEYARVIDDQRDSLGFAI